MIKSDQNQGKISKLKLRYPNHLRCAQPPELKGQRLRDIKLIQNVEKQNPTIEPSWYKHYYRSSSNPHTFEIVSTRLPYWHYISTQRPDLSSQITDLIRQLIDQSREFIKRPEFLFAAGFASAIFVMIVGYCTFKLIYKLLNFSSEKTVPPLIKFCRRFGSRTYDCVLIIGTEAFKLMKRDRLHTNQKENLLKNAEKIDTTNPNFVLFYDRESEATSIVE